MKIIIPEIVEHIDHLKGVSKKDFNRVYAAARRQQAVLALTSGNLTRVAKLQRYHAQGDDDGERKAGLVCV